MLDEFLFLNPDTAIAFNELTPNKKNKIITNVRKLKNRTELAEFLLKFKTTLEASLAENT